MGNWCTDLTAMPRLNRAVRDWSLSFFTALHGYGIDMAASFSMELGNGDPSASVGIAQAGPAGESDPVADAVAADKFLSPTSLAFWQEAYAEVAWGSRQSRGVGAVLAVWRSAMVVLRE